MEFIVCRLQDTVAHFIKELQTCLIPICPLDKASISNSLTCESKITKYLQ